MRNLEETVPPHPQKANPRKPKKKKDKQKETFKVVLGGWRVGKKPDKPASWSLLWTRPNGFHPDKF